MSLDLTGASFPSFPQHVYSLHVFSPSSTQSNTPVQNMYSKQITYPANPDVEELRRDMEQLREQNRRLQSSLEHFLENQITASTSAPPPAPSFSEFTPTTSHFIKPPRKVKDPKPYFGVSTDLRRFRHQLQMVFDQTPAYFTKTKAWNRISYTLSFCGAGVMAEWAEAYRVWRDTLRERDSEDYPWREQS